MIVLPYMKYILTLALVLVTTLGLAACSPAEELENAASDAIQQEVDGILGGGEEEGSDSDADAEDEADSEDEESDE